MEVSCVEVPLVSFATLAIAALGDDGEWATLVGEGLFRFNEPGEAVRESASTPRTCDMAIADASQPWDVQHGLPCREDRVECDTEGGCDAPEVHVSSATRQEVGTWRGGETRWRGRIAGE